MNAKMDGTKRDTSLSAMRKAFSYEACEELSEGLYYCAKHNLWWKAGVVYDELSASHNGIIGMGAQLKRTIRNEAIQTAGLRSK